MVTKVALSMLENKVIKNADVTDNILTLTFSDNSEKTLTLASGDAGGGDSGPIVGKSGTLVGVVSIADAMQYDIQHQQSEPFIPTPDLQMNIDVKEPGSYYAVALSNLCGTHETKPGETVSTTYSGKSWTMNSRNSAGVGRITMDGRAQDRFFQTDTLCPGGTSVCLSVGRLFTDVTVGMHNIAVAYFQHPALDQIAVRSITLAVFRV